MNFKKNFSELNLAKIDILYLFVLIIFSTLISINMINFNLNLGIYCSDVFVYLINSLNFTGINVDATSTMYLSPVICFLTSILFRFGIVDELAIYIVTACFGILANIGLYVFLKNKFSPILSLTGAILFGSFTLNLLWWGNGTLDIPAVALSIWVIIFSIIAIDKNPKFYLIAIPLFVISVFTRYTTIFIFPLVLLYYFTKHDFFVYLDNLISDRESFKNDFKTFLRSDNCKYLTIGIIISVIITIVLVVVILAFGSPLSFLTQTSTFASGSKGEIIDNAYTFDTFFYVHEFLNFLFANKIVFNNVIPIISNPSPISYLIVSILVVGMGIGFYKLIIRFKSTLKSEYNLGFKTKNFANSLKIGFVLCIILGILSFKINSLITITLMLIALVILFSLLINYFDRLDYSITALALAWFLIYFIFFTFLNIKVNRYIIPALPAFVYFVIYAFDFILKAFFGDETNENSNYFKDNNRECNFSKHDLKSLFKYIIPIILIIIFVVSAFSFNGIVEVNESINSPKVMAKYLMHYDSNYQEHHVATDNQRVYNWFFKSYTIPIAKDNIDVLESSNITYYISKHSLGLKNYTKIYTVDNLYLYKHI